MPSHKQRRGKKRSHKHKHRNRSRPSMRKRNIQKKIEGKKENIPHNTSTCNVDLRDIGTYMENRGEMIRQMFSSVAEDFLTKSAPRILKQATKEELKRICFEELTRMSAEVIFKILEGIPCDLEATDSTEGCSTKKKYDLKTCKICSGQTSKSSSAAEKCCTKSQDCDKQEMALRLGDKGHIPDVESEEQSTSSHPSVTKKLAKVAPFHFSIPKPENPQPPVFSDEEEVDSSEIDGEINHETVNLSVEEGAVNEEDEGEEPIDEVLPHDNKLDGSNDNQEISREDMQQYLAEMVELEYRARAIRSMLANMDKYKS